MFFRIDIHIDRLAAFKNLVTDVAGFVIFDLSKEYKANNNPKIIWYDGIYLSR